MVAVIVIPCYNEENRLNKQAFMDFVKENPSVAFLFVNDGSSDNTLDILTQLINNQENLLLLNLEKNSGKAEAVRQGVLYVAENYDCDFIGFLDADLAIPLDEILNFLHIMQRYDFNAVTALRLMRLGAKIKRKFFRHIFSRIFATTTSVLLKLPVYDTQCGAKMYKKQIIKPLFNDRFISKWLFDVEILARYIKIFGRENAIINIYECPLYRCDDLDGSSLKARDFLNAPVELWKIKRKYL